MAFKQLIEELDRFREHLLEFGGPRFCETHTPCAEHTGFPDGASIRTPRLKTRLEAQVFLTTIAERLIAQVTESEFASDLVDEALAVSSHLRGAPSFAHQVRRDPAKARAMFVSRMQKAQRYSNYCRCNGDPKKMPKCPIHKFTLWIEAAEAELEHRREHGYASGHGGIRSSGGSSGHTDGQPGTEEAEA